MATVVVDANGEVMLQKPVLEQAGARPGDTLEVTLRVVNRRPARARTWDGVAGKLVPPTGVSLTIDEMNDAIAKAATEAGLSGLRGR
ncbi:MAG: hypothetical protein EON87_15520 [Brevundimonas sp.]|nr:MAG: hypothetical protein EON87_15520 [Brevundimonas sp.]